MTIENVLLTLINDKRIKWEELLVLLEEIYGDHPKPIRRSRRNEAIEGIPTSGGLLQQLEHDQTISYDPLMMNTINQTINSQFTQTNAYPIYTTTLDSVFHLDI